MILAPELQSGAGRGRGGGGIPPPDPHPVPAGGPAGRPGGGRASLPPEASRLRVAFLGGDSHPLALGRTLSAARRLLSRDNCQVFLFIRDAKVGAPDMEAALGEAQSSGLIVFKLPQLPALGPRR